MVVRALWMVRSSAVLLDCCRFLPTGAAMFWASLGPNHTPSLAWASTSPLFIHKLSVDAVMSSRFVSLSSFVAWVVRLFSGFPSILKFLWILPFEDVLRLKIFTLSGFPIAWHFDASLSS